MTSDRTTQQAAALAYIEAGAPLTVAAKAAGTTARTLYRWIDASPEFGRRVEAARNLHAGRTVDLQPTYANLKRSGRLPEVRLAMVEALWGGASFTEACAVAGVPRHVGRYIASKDHSLRLLFLLDRQGAE